MNTQHSPAILIVDDESSFLKLASFALRMAGISAVDTCNDSRQVMALLEQKHYCVITLDITMPHLSGLNLLSTISRQHPDTTIIMITGYNDIETAVSCMKEGAYDYLVKPLTKERLTTTVMRALEFRALQEENLQLKNTLLDGSLKNAAAFSAMVTQNESLLNLFRYVETIANTPLPILITGETGVGKELLASALHEVSARPGKFVSVNIAGLDDAIFSDTLFGHCSGAFTGADKERKGLVEQASQGTLFLDEIGDLSYESQVKLLRLLQEGSYYPVGSDIPRQTTARIVAATNKSLAQLQSSDSFRSDLYYRLRSHHVNIPPLRQRVDDIPFLLEHFLQEAAQAMGKRKPTPPRELFVLLQNHPFIGNVRELRSMVYDAVARHSSGTLSMQVFQEHISQNTSPTSASSTALDELGGDALPTNFPTLRDAELKLIEEALRRAQGNKTLAAKMLGLTRQALTSRLKKFQD
jgi:DNA-binding NtrC family response regulator